MILADGGGRWPVEDRSVKVFFSSRAIHLLPAGHVVAEAFRAASSGGARLIVGRVQRARESLRTRLRHEMRGRLRELGFEPVEGRSREQEVLATCCARGARPLEPLAAAAWPASYSAESILEAWRGKSGLAGLDVPASIKDSVLSALECWVTENFGSPGTQHESEEKYVLEGVQLPAEC